MYNGCRFQSQKGSPVEISPKGTPMNRFYFRHLYSTLLALGLVLLSSVLVLPAADTSFPLPAPPVAKKEPKITEINGRKLVDNYYWLRDKKNPDVKAYLQAENVYTDAVMKPTEPLQKKLYEEMLSRIKETDVEVPYKEGGYFYYSRTEAGKQYAIHCRKKGSMDAAEEVLLDVNELAKGQAFMSLGAFDVSDDGNLLAYTTDNTGFRQFTLAVKDLRTGKTLVDHAERVDSVAWANDNKTLFYTIEDEVSKRSYQMYRHTVGTSGPGTLVYEEKDEKFDIETEKTRSKAYVLLLSESHTTSEARYIPAGQPMAEWKLLEPRKQGVEYYPDHNGDFFYIRVNDTGRNFRLVKAPVADPGIKNWQEVVPNRTDVMLDGTDFFKNYYISYEREKGLPQIRATNLQSGESRRIEFPEPAYETYPYANLEYDTNKFRYSYQSFITPRSIFEYDLASGSSTLLKQKEVPGGYDRTRYQVEQIYATASDGVKIPISLVHLKGAILDGKRPIYLTAYGSYGDSYDIGFDPDIFSMVDRGVVVSVAHIRGGGEMGKAWHDDGRMMHKKNTFTDFIASAEYLLAQGYGSKDRLVIEGRSAGGLLMGAVLNMRPDLFHAALVGVPFVDVMNTMLDESLPLTVGEFEEWGNPKEKPAFDYMLTYSPYDNIEAKAYPNMLVRTSFNDSQVMYWEPAKYVAKMRALRTDHNILILKTNMSPAGHGGASGRYDRLHEAAFDYAYFLTQMGINN
jgi:oligopeptidase B